MLNDKKLQQTLNKLSEAHNLVQKYRTMIHKHCIEVYGVDPADVDNDYFIDSCDDGAGICESMSVEKFKKSMRDNIELSAKNAT